MIPLDNSNHSTYYTFEDTIKEVPPVSPPSPVERKSNGRKVRFNQRRNQFYESNVQRQDIDNAWFRDADYKRFRAHVKKVIAKFKEEAESDQAKNLFMVILEDLYDTVRSIDYVVKGNVMKILTPEQQHNVLNLFKACGPEADLIGLEFHVVTNITVEAQRERENIQEVVDDIQGEYERGLWETSDSFCQELRDSCLNFSQASTLFARFMAQAQLEAV
uniref:Uncharacterized protein n=1 Tax=Entomoneis paludosa TaxID=265537 RepID=A0A7S3DRT0_9STRA|mmetsp:Transcript_32062/g.66945  ORF Transcript_32062/g.66945 Transcript_32062/m.66945 type:complete len:218 (+) Transcript_32062:101-754(+)|eukprot:CAMPEP_0172459562 /NCGR_PEP_ID=MMETSP1065-20121228/33223_1 /TAXON_ID=265537 /ORGANISM="Amphiprora paludosa, Strain CCMP125" /LENGTH=217 /DNA_ID=CAMNT_0013214297 /DNA_START=27 /DNA_END=680 /DNA_ORIENTATION=-